MTENNDETKNELEKVIKEEFWEVYHKTTSKLSNICRQLAFAEGGVCWFFLKECGQSLPLDIKIILTFLVFFFIFDACQYFVLAINNKNLAMIYEKQVKKQIITSKSEIFRPAWINHPANFCFTLKLFSIGIASFLLIGKLYYQ